MDDSGGRKPSLGVMTEFGAVLFDEPPFTTRFHGQGEPTPEMMREFADWLAAHSRGRAVMVSDNPAFDAMWMFDAFHRLYGSNPFGHSSRRIGDLYAGVVGDMWKASAWKRLRRTKHTHHPVDDALGNAEALHAIVEMMRTKVTSLRLLELHAEVAALDEHYGYEADIDWNYYHISGWYCRGKNCGQPEGKAHLDGCPVGAFDEFLRRIES